jgi:putative flippase GtrA
VKIVRYFFAGGVAALIDWSLFALLAIFFGMPYLVAAAISFTLATLANYLLSIRFVFESGVRFSRGRETAMVYVVSAIGLGINLMILEFLVASLDVHPMASKIVATGIVFMWNYLARANVIFRRAP